MTEMDYWRQLDIVSPTALDKIEVTLIGAGGIGSPTALALTKMGLKNLTVYDHDTVELHNLPNQIYGPKHLEMPKALALQEVVRELSGIEIDARPEKYTPASPTPKGVVISAVDSMEVRQAIWKTVKLRVPVTHYIDGRMGGQVAWVQCVTPYQPDDIEWYEKTLYSDSDAVDEPCTARAIWYNTMGIGSHIAHLVKRVANGETVPVEVMFDFQNMILVSR